MWTLITVFLNSKSFKFPSNAADDEPRFIAIKIDALDNFIEGEDGSVRQFFEWILASTLDRLPLVYGDSLNPSSIDTQEWGPFQCQSRPHFHDLTKLQWAISHKWFGPIVRVDLVIPGEVLFYRDPKFSMPRRHLKTISLNIIYPRSTYYHWRETCRSS